MYKRQLLKWERVAERITELIRQNRYLSQQNAPTQHQPQPAIQRLFEQYKLAIGNALLKDEAFVNACCNSDRQNAYLEGAEAIRRIVTASDDLQLTRLYFDMPAFHDQLHQELLDEIYPTLATAAIPSHSQVTQADIDAKQKKHEPEQNPDYQLLSRLKADCDYFLGAGGCAEKHLWAGSVRAQIAKCLLYTSRCV